MSAVFWLSSLSFFMWKVFRRIRPQFSTKHEYRWGFQHPSYWKYAAISWGCPLLVTTITILVQFLPDEYTKNFTKPGIGETQCFLDENQATLFYFHIINAPLLVSLQRTREPV